MLFHFCLKHNCEQSFTADVSVGFCAFKRSINIQVILILSFKKKFAALIFNYITKVISMTEVPSMHCFCCTAVHKMT